MGLHANWLLIHAYDWLSIADQEYITQTPAWCREQLVQSEIREPIDIRGLPQGTVHRMIPNAALVLLLLAVCAYNAHGGEPRGSLTGWRPQGPGHPSAEVVRCLSSALQVGCGAFECLENSTCDTVGMFDICKSFLSTAATFDTQGQVFIKESLKCIAHGITSKAFLAIERCPTFQRLIAEVQKGCYRKLDMCSIVQSNLGAITEVVQLPQPFPNRYYNMLLTSLLACGGEVVEIIQDSVMEKIGAPMARLFQLLLTSHCGQDQSGGDPSPKPPSEPPKLKIYVQKPQDEGPSSLKPGSSEGV